jgi:amino acid transporter
MSTYEFIVSMVGFLVICVLGTLMTCRNTKSQRERTFVLKAAGWQAVLGFGILSAYYYFQWNKPLLVYAVVLATWAPIMFWIERRVQRIGTQQNDTDT